MKTELEKKIKELGGKLLPVEEWDDCIQDLLTEEKIKSEIRNKKVLVIDGRAELSYAKIGKKQWQVCYKWVPLWRMHAFSDCFVENWRTMFKEANFFAIPCGEEDISESQELLQKNGFEVSNFEGF